ncbi:MAG: DUF1573 domain-containing protein [Bacteroidales bacterium]|nr:DUF1573 domain-containing protein [Bacteroidales bacterium]MCF8457425.1 DUF1573 domain-containing protein [Bacteroidales bacterium]
MKKIAILIWVSLFIVPLGYSQVNQEETPASSDAVEITFEKTIHDFGKIPYRGNGECEFVFKNTGKDPLVLTNVKTSCGCTVPTWPREPIEKKKDGTIKIKYDTKRQGAFTKTITVFSNASNSPVQLTIRGDVEKPSAEEMEELRIERERRAAQNKQKFNQPEPKTPEKSVIEKEKSLPEQK